MKKLDIKFSIKCPLHDVKSNLVRNVRPIVNFINIKRTDFSYERHFGSFYYVHVTRKKLPPKQCSYEKFALIR